MRQKVRDILIILILVFPSLWMALYTYPVQDDFHYAYYAKELMEQGYSLLHMAWYKTVDYYLTFCGCYTSSFLGYLMSGIIDCSIVGIRVYEICSMIVFYIACWFFFDAVWVKMLRFPKNLRNRLYILLLTCIHAIFYIPEQEDYYWFITSVQYLTILSMILFGVLAFILAVERGQEKSLNTSERWKTVGLLVCAALLGFLGSGAALNIAFLCCIFYLLVSVYYLFIKKGKWYQIIPVSAVTLTGLVINGVAPGNYIRSGGAKGFGQIQEALVKSIQYAWERNVSLFCNPVFWAVILLLFWSLISFMKARNFSYSFPLPITFTLALFGLTAAMIFPVVLGYGYDIYAIMCRSNFISDFTIYVLSFLAVFYWAGWSVKHDILPTKTPKYTSQLVILGVLVLAIIGFMVQKDQNAYVKVVKEIVSGDAKEYSDYVVSFYDAVENSHDDIVTVEIPRVIDTVCLIDPKIYLEEYDPDEEYGNQTIARYYGKKAIYYLTETDRKDGN